SLAVPDRLAWHAVLRELIDQRARQDEIEERIYLVRRRRLLLRPLHSPEDRENPDRGQQRPTAIRELSRGRRQTSTVDRRLIAARDVERNDPRGVFGRRGKTTGFRFRHAISPFVDREQVTYLSGAG